MSKILVEEEYQHDYSYETTQPMGKNFDARFKPQLTPKQMLCLGIFGGRLLYQCAPRIPG